eukprot:7769291-Pyramimonas_sp.AAC.1
MLARVATMTACLALSARPPVQNWRELEAGRLIPNDLAMRSDTTLANMRRLRGRNNTGSE